MAPVVDGADTVLGLQRLINMTGEHRWTGNFLLYVFKNDFFLSVSGQILYFVIAFFSYTVLSRNECLNDRLD